MTPAPDSTVEEELGLRVEDLSSGGVDFDPVPVRVFGENTNNDGEAGTAPMSPPIYPV